MKFEIYKKSQGKYTRLCTFGGAMAIGIIGAVILSEQLVVLTHKNMLGDAGIYLQYGIPTMLILGLAWLMFWLVNRPASADFLIATESEMKKVSWSSRKEIVGSTKVVIVTTFIMAGILFGVDIIFIMFFQLITLNPSF
ncbi:MAG: preprotein translocase subunit SecE [Planctomycetes bacterium]|nr:preprotein translocase subunit SecE [Planctomycetota bacterium]